MIQMDPPGDWLAMRRVTPSVTFSVWPPATVRLPLEFRSKDTSRLATVISPSASRIKIGSSPVGRVSESQLAASDQLLVTPPASQKQGSFTKEAPVTPPEGAEPRQAMRTIPPTLSMVANGARRRPE